MSSVPSSRSIERGTTFEARFESVVDRPNPFQDVQLYVRFTSPSGRTRKVPGFWDGERTFRVRVSPDEEGTWTWATTASDPQDGGLHGVEGAFSCVPYQGTSRLTRHGALRIASAGTHFEHADGTPFFWLADTAWNGPLKASAADWDELLADRARKGFTVIQVVATNWLAAAADAEGRTAYLGRERIEIDPAFFQRLDGRMAAIERHGMVASPVMIWAAIWNKQTLDLNPGTYLPDDQIVLLARYLLARYGAQPTVWMLAGDSDYSGAQADRWRRVGRAVFADAPGALATMHPAGQLWCADEFRDERWFSFVGYQGGHGDDEKTFRWLVEGPPAKDWSTKPPRPIVNLEPNYEDHVGYTHRHVHDAFAVRRASYWSVLVSPPAGVTYGVHGVWSWESFPARPMAHWNSGMARPWREAMKLPGSESVGHLATFFGSFAWWTLRPAPELVATQPGAQDAGRWVAVARSEDGRTLAAYAPAGGSIELAAGAIPNGARVRVFDPRTGVFRAAFAVPSSGKIELPDGRDWAVLVG